MVERMNRVARARRTLVQRTSREPSAAEIALLLDDGITSQEVEELQKLGRETISLESPVGADDGEARLADFIPDSDDERPLELVAESRRRSDLADVLDDLSWRERRVLELRYGLGGELPMTLERIGAEVGVTRERVRQIESRTLAKLKHSRTAGRLAGTLD